MTPERFIFPQRRYETKPSPKDEKMLTDAESALLDSQEKARLNLKQLFSRKISHEEVEKQKQVLDMVRKQLTAYFSNYRLNPHLPKIDDVVNVVATSELNQEQARATLPSAVFSHITDPKNPGGNYMDLIIIKPIEMPGYKQEEFFRNIYEAIWLAHEAYHTTAPTKFRVYVEKDNATVAREERKGLNYTQYALGNIIEEGMAVLFAEQFAQDFVLLQLSPKDQKYFLNIRKEAEEPHRPVESIILLKDLNDEGIVLSNMYSMEVRIVKVLKKKLEAAGFNFNELVENARLHNKTISLAKAIEKVFGKGMYGKIISGHRKGDKHSNKTMEEDLEEILNVLEKA